jgi:phenylacetate-CoA ligase
MKNKTLQQIIQNAYETVPYYNFILNSNDRYLKNYNDISDLQCLPVTTKDTIKQYGWANFIHQGYLDKDLRLLLNKDIHLEKTSGTTAEAMQIPWKNNDYFSSTQRHWSFRQQKGNITLSDRYCCVWHDKKHNKPYTIEKNFLKINTLFISEQNILDCIQAISTFNPVWLYMPPSMLYILISFAEKYKLRFCENVRYIEFASEPVLPVYRNAIENYFKLKAFDMYGCTETNGIAYECEYGHYHLMADNVLTEIVEDDKNIGYDHIGKVCLTSLHNTLMPMIRYCLNDEAFICKISCPCGNTQPIICLQNTRLPEFLYFNDKNIFPYWE